MSFDMDLDFQNNSQLDYWSIYYEEIQDVADYEEIKIKSRRMKRVPKIKLDKIKKQPQHRKQSTNIKHQCLNTSLLQRQQYSQEPAEGVFQFSQMNLSGDHHQTNDIPISEITLGINKMSLQ